MWLMATVLDSTRDLVQLFEQLQQQCALEGIAVRRPVESKMRAGQEWCLHGAGGHVCEWKQEA